MGAGWRREEDGTGVEGDDTDAAGTENEVLRRIMSKVRIEVGGQELANTITGSSGAAAVAPAGERLTASKARVAEQTWGTMPDAPAANQKSR